MPRALLLTGDAAEELDTMYPYYRVQEGGWDVDVASLTDYLGRIVRGERA